MSAAFDQDDTIAAIATPAGAGLRGLVRLSGPDAWTIAVDGFTPALQHVRSRRPEFRRGQLRLAGLRPSLPAAIALWPAPRTYTGQDVAEIHLPASPPLLALTLAGCLSRGARHAQPGEFTLRAFLCGRLDLTRAEAVLGVIDAHNPAQLDAALRQLAGGLSGPILALRDRLLDLVAHLEANLDFVEEADVDPLARRALADELGGASADLAALADRLTRRDRPGGLPRVAIIGPPNAGKSSLFNTLVNRDQAIVSPHAGTTRDYLTATCECDGILVELVDTAGLAAPRSALESRAQTRTDAVARQADLVLLCSSLDVNVHRYEIPLNLGPVLHVRTKADLGVPGSMESDEGVATSAVTGAGLDCLRLAIARRLRDLDSEDNLPAGTAARCRESLARAAASLASAAALVAADGGEELISFELRLAIDELGKVVGAVVTDDILDRIFRRFCIGK